MKQRLGSKVGVWAIWGTVAATTASRAETVITTFDDFTSNALYAGWANATVDSGPDGYSITASGYGSNWKPTPVDATGETTVHLTVTLSTTAANNGKLGPIVTLEDADGTSFNFAWYGRNNGHYTLTKSVKVPTWVGAPGSVPGLDVATLTHLHVGLDPSDYSGSYTVVWEDLRLTGAPPMAITAKSFNPETQEFTLTWASRANKVYSVLHTANLANGFSPLVQDIPSEGASTIASVVVPADEVCYLRVQEQ